MLIIEAGACMQITLFMSVGSSKGNNLVGNIFCHRAVNVAIKGRSGKHPGLRVVCMQALRSGKALWSCVTLLCQSYQQDHISALTGVTVRGAVQLQSHGHPAAVLWNNRRSLPTKYDICRLRPHNAVLHSYQVDWSDIDVGVATRQNDVLKHSCIVGRLSYVCARSQPLQPIMINSDSHTHNQNIFSSNWC